MMTHGVPPASDTPAHGHEHTIRTHRHQILCTNDQQMA